MSVAVRAATPEDADAIVRLIRHLAEYEHALDEVETTPERVAEQLRADRPPFEALLAERDGRAVGLALFFQNYSTWTGRPGIYLEDLVIDESERGGGVGRALMRELARIARERDCARLELVALDWNEPAIGFYLALGAQRLEEWTAYRFSGDALERLADESDASRGL